VSAGRCYKTLPIFPVLSRFVKKRYAHTGAPGIQDPNLRFEHGMCVLPHPHKNNGGEDAAFICLKSGMVGVADGVGGWVERGIDSGQYSRNLLSNAKQISGHIETARVENRRKKATEENSIHKKDETGTKAPTDQKTLADLMRVLIGAHKVTEDEGSTTVCLISYDGHVLRAANLGDSGFAVVRNRKIFFKSEPQQHSFNFPYQIGHSLDNNDHPAMAELFEVELEAGDAVILGTDGLFDNVFDGDICKVVTDGRNKGMTPTEVSRSLAKFAQQLGQSAVKRSPFSIAAAKDGYLFMGGKLDDTSVVVTFVSEAEKRAVSPTGITVGTTEHDSHNDKVRLQFTGAEDQVPRSHSRL